MQHEYLAAYITELALPEYSALQWLPSIIAAAAVLLARHLCAINIPIMGSLQPWSPTLQHYSGYRSAYTHIHSIRARFFSLQFCSETLRHNDWAGALSARRSGSAPQEAALEARRGFSAPALSSSPLSPVATQCCALPEFLRLSP